MQAKFAPRIGFALQRLPLFESLRRIAARHGGRCVSTEYKNNRAPLRWRCAEGHEFVARPAALMRGSWCPRCNPRRSKRLEQVRTMAERRGGRCLSTEYVGVFEPMRFECAQGHRWWTSASHILHAKTWCKRCRGTPRDSLERLQRIARRHGGRCLSIEYGGTRAPLLWQCRKGHEWHATPAAIVKGRWCRLCRAHAAGPMLSLDEMHRMAEERGGRCLSTYNFLRKTKWVSETGFRTR